MNNFYVYADYSPAALAMAGVRSTSASTTAADVALSLIHI